MTAPAVAYAVKRVHDDGREQWDDSAGWVFPWTARHLYDLRPDEDDYDAGDGWTLHVVPVRRVVRPRAIRVGDEVTAAGWGLRRFTVGEIVGGFAMIEAVNSDAVYRVPVSALAPKRGGKKKGA